ncbi:MAG: hypothetical protein ACM3X4_01590 [Ignavibacteriales bacterium]
MRRRILLLALVACLLVGCSTPRTYQGIRIEGPEDFQDNIEHALKLIEWKSPGQFKDVRRLVKKIGLVQNSPAPGLAAYCDSRDGIYFVQEQYDAILKQAEAHPPAVYAIPALLVHETTHLVQVQEGRPANSEEGEREALQAEKGLLLSLGLPFDVVENACSDDRLRSRHWEALGATQ